MDLVRSMSGLFKWRQFEPEVAIVLRERRIGPQALHFRMVQLVGRMLGRGLKTLEHARGFTRAVLVRNWADDPGQLPTKGGS